MSKIPKIKLRTKIILSVFIVFGAVLIIAWHSVSQPNYGKITYPSLDVEGSSNSNKPKDYNGHYVSFRYPARYKVLDNSLSGQILQSVSLESTDKTDISIAITVQSGSLSGNSSVNYRKATPSIYTETSSSPSTIDFTSSSNGFEEDAFIAYNGLITSVVFTGPSKDIIGNDFSSLINSIIWN